MDDHEKDLPMGWRAEDEEVPIRVSCETCGFMGQTIVPFDAQDEAEHVHDQFKRQHARRGCTEKLSVFGVNYDYVIPGEFGPTDHLEFVETE